MHAFILNRIIKVQPNELRRTMKHCIMLRVQIPMFTSRSLSAIHKTKVRSETIEPFCKMLLHGPAARENSEFPFGKCPYGVEDYYQYRIAKKKSRNSR